MLFCVKFYVFFLINPRKFAPTIKNNFMSYIRHEATLQLREKKNIAPHTHLERCGSSQYFISSRELLRQFRCVTDFCVVKLVARSKNKQNTGRRVFNAFREQTSIIFSTRLICVYISCGIVHCHG